MSCQSVRFVGRKEFWQEFLHFFCLPLNVLNLYSKEDFLDSESIIFDTESKLYSPKVVGEDMVLGENLAEGMKECKGGVTGWKVQKESVSLYIGSIFSGSATLCTLISMSGVLVGL